MLEEGEEEAMDEGEDDMDGEEEDDAESMLEEGEEDMDEGEEDGKSPRWREQTGLWRGQKSVNCWWSIIVSGKCIRLRGVYHYAGDYHHVY